MAEPLTNTSNAARNALPSGEEQLLALVDLIRSSVTDIINEHKKANVLIPSLDSASATNGLFDKLEATTPSLRRAIRIVQGACDQLTASVSNPGLFLFTKGISFTESECLQVVVSAKIADILAQEPNGLHITELSARTGIPADNLGRVLRFLSTGHIFIEKHPNIFVNNRLSMHLRSQESACAIMKLLVNNCFEISPFLYDTLSQTEHSATLAPSIFEKRNGLKFFDFLENDKETNSMFARAMIGFGDITGKAMFTTVYPWDTLSRTEAVSVCDIGGGSGHAVMALMKAYPEHDFRAVVQDRPGMLVQAKKLWETQFPSAIEKKHVDFVPIDFLKEAPVAGCDYYYLRLCLHNWPDAEALAILSHIREAMRAKPSSKFLLHDFVLQRATSETTTLEKTSTYEGLDIAPAPLLANYGVGSAIGYGMDITMMGLLNSKERTFDELMNLSSQAGLKFERFWEAGVVDIMEFSLKRD